MIINIKHHSRKNIIGKLNKILWVIKYNHQTNNNLLNNNKKKILYKNS